MTEMKRNQVSNSVGYDQWASFYDEYPNPTIAVDELAFPILWHQLRKKNILEIGCGTGRHTQKLLTLGNQVTGIDLSGEMLNIAKKKLSGKKFTPIHDDFLNHPHFGAESYDVVIASLVLEHFKNLDLFFEKVYFVLRKTGEFLLSEIHPDRALKGSLAHFKDPKTAEEIFLESTAHSSNDIELHAKKFGLQLKKKITVRGNADLFEGYPQWNKFIDVPMIQMWKFEK